MKTVFKQDKIDSQMVYFDVLPDTELDEISVEMIRCNRKELIGIAPIRFITENGIVNRIEYDFTDKQTLKSYLCEFAISKKKFADISRKILNALDACRFHMIPDEQIYLDIDMVYLDIATMSISLICLPVKGNNEAYDLKKFFIRFIENIYLDTGSENEDVDFQRIYDMLPAQVLNTELMRGNLDVLMNGEKRIDSSDNPDSKPVKMPVIPKVHTQSTLVDVVQENGSVSRIENVKPEKKKLLNSFGMTLQKGENRIMQTPTAANLRSKLRKAQSNTVLELQLLNKSTEQPVSKNSNNKGCTVLIVHDDPDETAYLLYGTRKIRIDAEGTSLGRLGGTANQKMDILLDSIHVSSDHAFISYDFNKMKYVVTDHSSTGTYLNGNRIQKNAPIEINHNDMLVFGDVPCRIIIEKKSNS